MGRFAPSPVPPITPDGWTSLTPSLPSSTMSRCFSQGIAEACRPALAGGVPRPDFRAPRPSTDANEHGVAAPDLDAGELLPRFEIGRVDRRRGLEVRHPLQERHVHENRARDDAGAHAIDGVGFTA